MATEFDLDKSGNISVFPLTGFATALAGGMACLLRLEHMVSQAEPEMRQAIQLAMTPAQARLLAQDLLQMAETAERSGQSGAPQ